MAIDPVLLRAAFGSFPTGVTVVTTRAADGTMLGFTANSFASVSLDPPLLLVCPGKTLTSAAAFQSCTRFAVSVLAEGQEDVANTFAGYPGDRFAKVNWTADASGMPLIDGAAAQFSCMSRNIVDAGDHVILIGEVDAFTHSGKRGLGFSAGRYFSLGLERAAAEAPQAGRPSIAGAIVESEGCVLLSEGAGGFSVPSTRIDPRHSTRTALSAWFAECGVPIQLGKAYSVFDGKGGAHFMYFLATGDRHDPGTIGRFVGINDLRALTYASHADRTMIERFVLESRTGRFGLYVGNSDTGYVHADTGTAKREG
jgi:flavin reductase (DIM6/NTAB) family NADH-FMN oxidoreductase RutF